MRKIHLILGLGLLSLGAKAQPIDIGAALPAVTIERGGEILLNGAKVSLHPWHSETLVQGKKQLIIHVAGRLSAKQQLENVILSLQPLGLSQQGIATTTIVDLDDSLWGSSPFVEQSIIGSKKNQPDNHFVLDKSGIAAHRWQLLAHSAAVILVNPQGQVQFFQQAPFSSQQIQQLIRELKNK